MPCAHGHRYLLGDPKRRTIILTSFLLLASIGVFWSFSKPHTGFLNPQSGLHFTTTVQNQIESNIDLGSVDLFAALDSQASLTQNTVLTSFDQQLYRKIFAAQKQGEWKQANALLKRVHNPLLKGHVLYNRYIQAEDYQSSYPELRAWMTTYGDHPDAYKVYQLAQKRRHSNPASLPAPHIAKKLFGSLELNFFTKEVMPQPQGHRPSNRVEADVRQLLQTIKKYLANDQITFAYDTLGKSKASRMLTNSEYDAVLGEIAAAYYYFGKTDTALHVATQAAQRSGANVPVANWIAGLASWRMHHYKQAAHFFATVNNSPSHNPWMLSAAAFWTARAHERLGEKNLQNDWLQEAASYPRTFYGLVAQSALGRHEDFSWDEPVLSDPLIDQLRKNQAGLRGLALMDIGQKELAEKEFSQIHPNGNRRTEKALVAVAHHYQLANLSLRLGNAVNQPDGKLYDIALYPVVPWKGDAKTGIDPALINALIRQESKFDPNAKNSRSGAKGLMQLMPRTAKFIGRGLDASRLHDPETNIALGQRYVRYLLNMSHVDNNLLYMAAAYNAGPGNLERWQKTIPYQDDPFLFIESLPLSETRAFVERVMTNYWIYAQRFEQETQTLEDMASEKWPSYAAQDDEIKLVAYRTISP